MEAIYFDVGMKAGKSLENNTMLKSAVFGLHMFLIYFRFTVCNLPCYSILCTAWFLGNTRRALILCTL